ncbi:hypothetical protein LEP1GSC043_4812, partial [Leptospira weilii str. Ecochallenge]
MILHRISRFDTVTKQNKVLKSPIDPENVFERKK